MSQLQDCSVMCTKNRSYCKNEKKRKSQGEGGCVKRMEVIVKRKKSQGGGVRVDVNGEVEKKSFCENSKKKIFFWGGGEGGGSGWGVRVDVNGEVKLL